MNVLLMQKVSGNSYCGTSNWKAAKNSAHKRSKLDETGIDVAGCRHAIAQGAVNMYQGELFGYTHYLQVNHEGFNFCGRMLSASIGHGLHHYRRVCLHQVPYL
jgi:hypothetical protein